MIWLGVIVGAMLIAWATWWVTLEIQAVYREFLVEREIAKGGGTFTWMGLHFTVDVEQEEEE